MFKYTLRAKNVVFLTDSHSKVWYLSFIVYMQSGAFPSNPSQGYSLHLVFEDIKKDNINLVL